MSHPHSLLPLHIPLGSYKRQVAEGVGAFPSMVPCCFLVAMLAPLVLALEQSPDMVIKEGQSVNLECSKKKSSNRAMYWFMLPSEKNSSLTQMVYAFEGATAVVEKGFESHFKSSNIQGDSITLSIEHAFLNDSGTYYCAESDHSGETAEGAEHKLVPAQPGPAFHLVGAARGRMITSHSLAALLPCLAFLLFSHAYSLFVHYCLHASPGLPLHLTLICTILQSALLLLYVSLPFSTFSFLSSICTPLTSSYLTPVNPAYTSHCEKEGVLVWEVLGAPVDKGRPGRCGSSQQHEGAAHMLLCYNACSVVVLWPRNMNSRAQACANSGKVLCGSLTPPCRVVSGAGNTFLPALDPHTVYL
ncbi:uncharacterized protein LOC132324232 [Haemorhous mexicanus]|uniref:uncharacterized protein LOC132324232 n=1 Tax=Haemorhous mexicanus TaxID=30427 RepID=UPI0028BD6C30|nr:uncharacterized protein LOC132324232 [Haemorhous mexicanus]